MYVRLLTAWMALLMALRYPERVHSLLLIGSAVNQCLYDGVFENIVNSLDKDVGTNLLRDFSGVVSVCLFDPSYSYRVNKEAPYTLRVWAYKKDPRTKHGGKRWRLLA